MGEKERAVGGEIGSPLHTLVDSILGQYPTPSLGGGNINELGSVARVPTNH